MIQFSEDKVCISLDPRLYLIKTKELEEIHEKAEDLVFLLDTLCNENIKILYNTNLDYCEIDCINLFNVDIKDPTFIYLSYIYEEYKQLMEQIYTYDSNESNIPIFNVYDKITKDILYTSFLEQEQKYYNSILYSDSSSHFVLEGMKYFISDSLNPLSLDIDALTLCSEENFYDIFSIYHWFFDKSFEKKVIFSEYIHKEINTLSVNYTEAIISLLRSIFYPNFVLKKTGANPNKFTIECHPDKNNNVKISNGQISFKPYRSHIVKQLETLDSPKDRFFYVNIDNIYIICGITNNHKFQYKISEELESHIKDNLI